MTSVRNDPIERLLARADALAAEGDWTGAIDLLTAENTRHPTTEFEQKLVALRHRAFRSLVSTPRPGPWPPAGDDRLAPSREIPEVTAQALDADILATAIRSRGSLLVRGLLDHDRADELRAMIDRVFEARTRPDAAAPPWYVPFEADDDYDFGVWERAFADFGAGVLGVDAPRVMFRLIDGLKAAGVQRVLTDYFGESPTISVKKTTLRRTAPDSAAGWHQDGAFLGTDTRTLNIWTALTPCGDDAPGLDVFPTRFDDLVETGGPDIYDWSVSDETAARYGPENIVRPVFDTGDALLFDQMTLHRTGIDPSMTSTRYAIETWFFAPSTYPVEQIPVCF